MELKKYNAISTPPYFVLFFILSYMPQILKRTRILHKIQFDYPAQNICLVFQVNKLFENSSLATRFVSSEVQQINRVRVRHRRSVGLTHGGVNVKVLVHVTADYLNAERAEKIFRTIRRQLEWYSLTLR